MQTVAWVKQIFMIARIYKESDLFETSFDLLNNGQITQASMGGRIEVARIAQDLIKAQLASRLCVSTKTIRNWEANRSEPRANKVNALAEILCVSVTWLITDFEAANDNI